MTVSCAGTDTLIVPVVLRVDFDHRSFRLYEDEAPMPIAEAEGFPFADVYGAMDAISWFYPIHFAYGDVPRDGLSTVAEFDVEQIPAHHYGHAMEGIAMPGRRFSGREPLPADQIISAVMQHLRLPGHLHLISP